MSVRIDPIPDDRAERMIADPAGYFEAARAEIREQVRAEIEEESRKRKRPKRKCWWWR
jgi:hypothetical protein